jgi:hypothetical protein
MGSRVWSGCRTIDGEIEAGIAILLLVDTGSLFFCFRAINSKYAFRFVLEVFGTVAFHWYILDAPFLERELLHY